MQALKIVFEISVIVAGEGLSPFKTTGVTKCVIYGSGNCRMDEKPVNAQYSPWKNVRTTGTAKYVRSIDGPPINNTYYTEQIAE